MNIRILTGSLASVTKSANELIRENPNWKPVALAAASPTKATVAMNLDESGEKRVAEIQLLGGAPDKLEQKLGEITNPAWSVASIATTASSEKSKAEPASIILITLPVL